MNSVVVSIPLTFTFEPKELDTIVAALELAPLPHNNTDPVLRKIGQAASTQIAEHTKSKDKTVNGQQEQRNETSA